MINVNNLTLNRSEKTVSKRFLFANEVSFCIIQQEVSLSLSLYVCLFLCVYVTTIKLSTDCVAENKIVSCKEKRKRVKESNKGPITYLREEGKKHLWQITNESINSLECTSTEGSKNKLMSK